MIGMQLTIPNLQKDFGDTSARQKRRMHWRLKNRLYENPQRSADTG
jgi:hypothetical protein